MEKASDHRRLAPAIVVTLVATAVVLGPLPAAAQRRPLAPPPRTQTEPSPKPEAAVATAADRPKDCVVKDRNGRPWSCSQPIYACDIENRMGNDEYDMFFHCDDDDDTDWLLPNGASTQNWVYREPRVTCWWRYAGNTMSGVVVWDVQWPRAKSCRVATEVGGSPCKIVFENRAATFVTPAGRRVLGDVAIKECSKNWGGFGGWLLFGLGCTYPKHEHPYVGRIVEKL